MHAGRRRTAGCVALVTASPATAPPRRASAEPDIDPEPRVIDLALGQTRSALARGARLLARRSGQGSSTISKRP